VNDRDIIERYGIDAPGASRCFACDLHHYSGMECPPVLPVGTEAGSA
jgi:hypothetical protein